MRPQSSPTAVDDLELSDLAFWSRPEPEREAAFAALRRLPSPPFFQELDFTNIGFPPGPGYYALVRHADIVEVSRRPTDFCSGKGATNTMDLPAEYNEFFGSMISMDDPRHARLRRIVSRAFSAKMLRSLDETLRSTARRIVDDLVERGPGDFVRPVAAEMPIAIICRLLGIPEADHQFIFERSCQIVGAFDPDYVADPNESTAAMLVAANDLAEHVHALGAQRMAEPADDLITSLVTANVDGEQLTPQELASFFILLVVAGNETTRNAISYGLKLLTDHPEQRRLWLSDFEAYAPTAVEEIVRVASPLIRMRRTATRDCEMNGHQFREGDKLLLMYWSANRDEDVFTDPERFDITRNPNPHLGYGSAGPHFCLGANLARAEIIAVYRELLRRLPDIRAVGEPRWLLSNFVNGLKHLDCSFS